MVERFEFYTDFEEFGFGFDVGKTINRFKYRYYFSVNIAFWLFIVRFRKQRLVTNKQALDCDPLGLFVGGVMSQNNTKTMTTDEIVDKLRSFEKNRLDLLNWVKSELKQETNTKLGKTMSPYRSEKIIFLRKIINKRQFKKLINCL